MTGAASAGADCVTPHGVLVEMYGLGVLICGPPGIGKSELAVALVDRGHRLVADDAPEIRMTERGELVGACPPGFEGFIEVRGLGVLDVRELFGASAMSGAVTLDLVLRLRSATEGPLTPAERLEGVRGEIRVLGVAVPESTLLVTSAGGLAVLAECAVRARLLARNGYDGVRDLVRRQRAAVDDAG